MALPAFVWYLLVGFSSVLAAGSAVLAWRRRPQPGSGPLTVMLVAVAWWSATYLGELLARTLAMKVFWARLEWLGSLLLPAMWVVFVLEYTGRDEYVTRRSVAALLVPWAVSVPLVWTNHVHHLVKTPLGLQRSGGLLLLDQQHGPWFVLVAVFSIALVLVSGALLVRLVASDQVAYRGQAVALLFAAGLPMVLNGYSVLFLEVDLTPFAFSVTGIAVLWAMSRSELLRATPVAALTGSEAVIESMDEGVLVVDTVGSVVDANGAAGTLLGVPREQLVGQQLTDVLPSDAESGPVGRCPTADNGVMEFSETELRDRHGNPVGRTLVLRDVTDRERHLERIEVLNRVLRHNLRTEMNVIMGNVQDIRSAVDGEAAESVEEVLRAGTELVDLAERARTVETIFERGERTEAGDPVADVVTDAVAAARDRDPDATIEVGSLPDRTVPVDPVVRVLLAEVLTNALTHGSDGDPWASIEVTAHDDAASIAVADDGEGIPPQERRVLESGAETPLHHGSGMGLWLVKWTVDRLGGQLQLEDRPGGGTVATVTVPAVRGAAIESAE